MHVGACAKPGHLPLGVAARGGLQTLHGVGKRFLTAQVSQKLLVADGLCGGAVFVKNARGKKHARFLEQTVLKHLLHAQTDASVEQGAVGVIQSDHGGAVGGLGNAGAAVGLALGDARGMVDLQRADHALDVVFVNGGGAFGIDRRKALVQSAVAVLRGKGEQLLAQGRIGVGLLKAASAQEGVKIEPRPAAKNGQASPGGKLVNDRGGRLDVFGAGEGGVGVGQVEKVMRNACLFLLGGLGGANVHAAVDLHGIAGEDLSAKALCQKDGQRRLSACRRTNDGQ